MHAAVHLHSLIFAGLQKAAPSIVGIYHAERTLCFYKSESSSESPSSSKSPPLNWALASALVSTFDSTLGFVDSTTPDGKEGAPCLLAANTDGMCDWLSPGAGQVGASILSCLSGCVPKDFSFGPYTVTVSDGPSRGPIAATNTQPPGDSFTRKPPLVQGTLCASLLLGHGREVSVVYKMIVAGAMHCNCTSQPCQLCFHSETLTCGGGARDDAWCRIERAKSV